MSDIEKSFEKTFKALGDKNRLKIINLLFAKPLCVCEIKLMLPLSQSTISGHLKVLKESGIVQDKKNGLWVEYRLKKDNPMTEEILRVLNISFYNDMEMKEARTKIQSVCREKVYKK